MLALARKQQRSSATFVFNTFQKIALIFVKHLFIHFVMRFSHSKGFVCFLCFNVLFLYVKSAATHFRMIHRKLQYGFIHSPVNSLPAKFRFYIYALNPPEQTVTPVTPFFGNHKGSCNLAPCFSNHIEPVFRFLKERYYTS